jgi:triacylglycerol lipase
MRSTIPFATSQSPQRPASGEVPPSATFTVPLQVTVSIGAIIMEGKSASPAVPVPTSQLQPTAIEVEAVSVPDFELARAIAAYVPVLSASYQLAAQKPFQLPTGYTRLADVRVDAMEVSDIESTLTAEQQRAVEHDRKALILGASPDFTEGLADPSAFGFVLKEDATGAILISIRGTQTPAEWLADFTPVPVPFFESPAMGLVHVGFAVFYHKVRGSIQAALSKVDSRTRITVLGHSLGGAMGVLCAADIERNMGKKNVDLCTFGGPRTGKIDFRVHFNHEISKCFRAVNALDIVPHVPSVITGWNHVGVEITVNGKGPSAHSLDAYLDGLKKLSQPEGTETFVAGRQVMSIRVP